MTKLRLLLLIVLYFNINPVSADYTIGTGCGYEVDNGDKNCLTVTPSVGTIVVDGKLLRSENWNTAIKKSLTGDAEGNIRFLREDNSVLHLFIIIQDAGYDTNTDKLRIRFDTRHSHGNDQVVFEINRSNSNYFRRFLNSDEPPVAWNPAMNMFVSSCNSGSCSIPDYSGYGWLVEISLRAEDLGLTQLNAIMGINIQADTGIVNGTAGSKITTIQWPPDPTTLQDKWAHLKFPSNMPPAILPPSSPFGLSIKVR